MNSATVAQRTPSIALPSVVDALGGEGDEPIELRGLERPAPGAKPELLDEAAHAGIVALAGRRTADELRRACVASANTALTALSMPCWYCSTPRSDVTTLAAPMTAKLPV